jgi:hypothetical protein
MARKKRTKSESPEAGMPQETSAAGVAVAEPEALAAAETPAPVERPAWIDGPPPPMEGPELNPPAPPKTWGDPYKPIFSSTAKGFEMGENRRFKQRVFKFHERPDQEVIDTLKNAGFTYRPNEKAWTIPANADTRALSEELAQQFSGQKPGRAL